MVSKILNRRIIWITSVIAVVVVAAIVFKSHLRGLSLPFNLSGPDVPPTVVEQVRDVTKKAGRQVIAPEGVSTAKAKRTTRVSTTTRIGTPVRVEEAPAEIDRRNIDALTADRPIGAVVPLATAAPAEEAGEVVIEVQKNIEVKVLEPEAKAKLKLPADVAHLDVLSSSTTPASRRPLTTLSLFDVETGETSHLIRSEPLPWVAFNRRGEVTVDGGMTQDGPALRFGVRYTFLELKALDVAGVGSVDTNGDYFLGLGLRYSW